MALTKGMDTLAPKDRVNTSRLAKDRVNIVDKAKDRVNRYINRIILVILLVWYLI